MKVAVVHNRDRSGVINTLGIQNRETYDPVTVEAVATALEKGGHAVRVIDGNMHVVEQLRDFMPRVVAGARPGMVFNMAYGIQGVSRYTHLPGLLEMLGVPYVGSSPQAHSLALDKVIAKLLFQSSGIPTPGFWNFATPDDRFDDLAFPAIVKPKMEAMSSGIKIVHDEPELRTAVAEIVNEFHQHVLVERFVAGREFTVGLLGNEDVEALPVVELDLEGDPMGIRADEGRRPRRKICPADLPPEKTAEMQEIARGAFRALGMADFGRIDLRMDETGTPFALEINSMADLGQSGAYVYSAGVAGYDFESLINRVLNVAAVRYFGAEYAQEEGGGHKRKSRDPLPVRVRAFLRSQTTTIEDGLRALAESSPETAVETVAGQLGQVGFQRAPSDHAPVDEDLLYFVNHAHPKNDVLLLVSLEEENESRAGSYREEGTRVSGAGVGGRGCLAVMTAALRALRFARVLRGIQCGVLIVLRGSARGGTARKDLERIARHSGRVLGVSASEPAGTVFASRAGSAHYRVELTPRRDRASRAASPPKAVAALCQRVTAVHRLSRPDSGVTVGGMVAFGFLYNNYLMALETEDPSHPYYLRPGAVPWSSAAPAIVFLKGKPWIAMGSPGSERIYSALAQVLSHVVDGSTPIDEAVRRPRLHCSIKGAVSLEAERFPAGVVEYLERQGYKVDPVEAYSFSLGCVQAVLRRQTGEGFQGVADPRRGGGAAGPA